MSKPVFHSIILTFVWSGLVGQNVANPQFLLREDGYYNMDTQSRIKLGFDVNDKIVSPINILNSKNILYRGGSDPNGDFHSIKGFADLKFLHRLVGYYSIQGNKIKAMTPLGLFIWGMRFRAFECHFEGIIKNKDTIENWHLVPPLPKADPRFNDNFRDLFIPISYYFVESKELLGLDSLIEQHRLKETKKKKRKK